MILYAADQEILIDAILGGGVGVVYANERDLSSYLGLGRAPDNADRLLRAAQIVIDHVTLGRIDVSQDHQAHAARMAVCAQVEYWLEVGEDIAITGPIEAPKIGSFSMSGRLPVLAPIARQYLTLAGLLSRAVRTG